MTQMVGLHLQLLFDTKQHSFKQAQPNKLESKSEWIYNKVTKYLLMISLLKATRGLRN